MSISFNRIPINLRLPGAWIEIDNSRAYNGLFTLPVRVLIIGPRLGGSAAAMTPERITRKGQAEQLFGVGSVIANMANAFRTANDWNDLWCIAVDDSEEGVAATGTLTFTGAPTAPGTLNLYLNGRRLQIGITTGQTIAAIATSVAGTINGQQNLDVTASANAGVVTVTAKHKGELGNEIDLRHSYYDGETLPPGLGLACSAMTGGTGNPEIQPVLDLIGDTWYTDFVTPYTDAANLTAIEAKLDVSYGPMKMIDGHAWCASRKSFSALTTLGDSRDSPHLTIINGFGAPQAPWEWAAAQAGIGVYYLGQDPARPLQNLKVPGLMPPVGADRYTDTERNLFLYDGISTWTVDDGGNVVMERIITTYKTNEAGAEDPSYLNIETLRTLATLRYDVRTFIPLRYPRHKLANDGTRFARGQAVVTPKIIRAELIARFGMWEAKGWTEDIDQYKADLLVERNTENVDRMDALIPPNIVNQFRTLAGLLQYRL
ncbi:MAG: phage tail protein [Rhodospirillaceae bacterium]|nr:MAG: phage tail protein [Rhodospirillaceae bacterium]